MTEHARIGVVVLTYNSVDDLAACLDGIVRQRGVDLRIVVVDNASAAENQRQLVDIFRSRMPDGEVLSVGDMPTARDITSRAFFIVNDVNAGYSAGNNIGMRLAVRFGCDAVLIVNPDIRIEDPEYLVRLSASMFADETCYVASSRILGLSGCDENPLRETGFWEELFWPLRLGPRSFRSPSTIVPPVGKMPVVAEKVHGCCMLIRSSFLRSIGYLDENVFLYCEEPILAVRVRASGGRIVVFPEVKAVHAHVASAKGNPSRRMLQFIRSRLYYLDRYSGYGPVRRAALRFSYCVLYAVHFVKARIGNV